MTDGPPDGAAPPESADMASEAPDWLAAMYDAHAAGLFRYAVMVLADRAAAEDAVQEVFTALARRGPRAARVAEGERYLRRAVRHACFNRLRARRRNGRPADRGARAWLEAVDPAAARPDERLAIERALDSLPPEQREVVHLKIYEGMTFQQIADATGTSINTAASRYRYALEKLRERLQCPASAGPGTRSS